MTLREQFEAEKKKEAISSTDLLFLTSSQNYIEWLENKLNGIDETIDIAERISNVLDKNIKEAIKKGFDRMNYLNNL